MPSFSEMPVPVKAAAFVAGGGSIIGAIGMFAGSGAKMTLILIGLALVLCAVVLLIYAWFLIAQRRKKSESLREELASKSLRTGSAGDVEEIRKREDLRIKFLKGVADYKKAGYELYAMPWFLIMGEPGSGKTLALKKSNIGFLPDLTDEFQGGAGTYTIDWWFTSDAVMLDTAGRFAMQSAGGSGQNSELAELLRLLKKHRRNCPVNGMILVIPAESLLSDTLEDRELAGGKKVDGIESKAKQLAKTILTVQTELDVRLPIIVWITKSDMVPGFRAFFEGVSRERQHQMLGWSNPDELDEPFRPDQLAEHMTSVIEGLRERRWSLLQQQKSFGDARMIDSVDSLYAFPENFGKIMDSLQEYLKHIFVRGNKRPFLRGIYFNSAITEGKEADKVLAEAMGMSLDQYKAGGAGFRREKAYFIGDSLLKKLFVEKNLVTRATKAMSSLRRRQWFLVGGITVAVMAMVVWGWFANDKLKKDIRSESLHWQYLAKRIHDQQLGFIQLIGTETGGAYPYRGAHSLDEFTDDTNYLGYYSKLAWFSGREIPVSRLFSLFGSKKSIGKEERQKAWRIAFKIGILEPVVDDTGKKLSELREWQGAPEEDALMAMLRWEGAVDKGSTIKPEFLTESDSSNTFLGSMIRFLASGMEVSDQFPAEHEPRLNDLLKQCLVDDPALGHLGEPPFVRFNETINPEFPSGPVGSALAQFRTVAAAKVKESQEKLNPFKSSLDSFNQLKSKEISLLAALADTAGDDLSDSNIDAVTGYFRELLSRYGAYQNSYRDAKAAYSSLNTSANLVVPALDHLFADAQNKISGPFERLRTEAGRLHAELTNVTLYPKVTEFIASTLTTSVSQLGMQFDQLRKEYVPFDWDYFSDDQGEADMDWRNGTYQKGLLLFKTRIPNWTDERDNPLKITLGAESNFLHELSSRAIRYPTNFYTLAPLDRRCKDAMQATAARALAYQTNYTARKYVEYCQAYLQQNLAFPYVYNEGAANDGMPLEKFNSMEGELQSLGTKAASLFGDRVPPSLAAMLKRLDAYSSIYKALTVSNGEIAVRTLLIEVPNQSLPETKAKYLKPGQDIEWSAKLKGPLGKAFNVLNTDPNNSWTVPLNESELILECGRNTEAQDWSSLLKLVGEWAPLKLLLDAEPIEEEPGKYVVRLRAPDGKYSPNGKFFVLKLSIKEGGKLPRKEDWPTPRE